MVTIITATSAFAAEQQPATPYVISIDESSGAKIIRDAAGGIVISGLRTPVVASTAEQQQQLHMLKAARDMAIQEPMQASSGDYYDIEENPIHIGTWGGVRAYARHTLGAYNSTLGYLTSYGDCSYYNTDGDAALPYRNGNATVKGQDVVDVAKYSYFDIRDLTTDNATTLQITDWGPDQQIHPDRIADIDKNDFRDLHGNTSDGLFYCRTWVPITNYNP